MGDTPLTADDLALFRKAATALDTAWSEPMLALLDMVDGYKQLVAAMWSANEGGPGVGIDTEGRPIWWGGQPGEWADMDPLAKERPALAALLDQALTPQGDPT